MLDWGLFLLNVAPSGTHQSAPAGCFAVTLRRICHAEALITRLSLALRLSVTTSPLLYSTHWLSFYTSSIWPRVVGGCCASQAVTHCVAELESETSGRRRPSPSRHQSGAGSRRAMYPQRTAGWPRFMAHVAMGGTVGITFHLASSSGGVQCSTDELVTGLKQLDLTS